VAEVPTSVLLSGGMDGSLITGLLAETGTPNLRTYAFASKLTCCSRSRPDATLLRTNLFLKSLEPNHEPARMQTLKIDPLYLKTTHGYARKRLSVPVQLARSETPLPHAAEPAQRRRDDDAA